VADCEISSWNLSASCESVVVTIMPLWFSFLEDEHWIDCSPWMSLSSIVIASHITVSIASTSVHIPLTWTNKSHPCIAVTMELHISGRLASPASLTQIHPEKSSLYWNAKVNLTYISGAHLTSKCCTVEVIAAHCSTFCCSGNICFATSCPQTSLLSKYHIDSLISNLLLTHSYSRPTEKHI